MRSRVLVSTLLLASCATRISNENPFDPNAPEVTQAAAILRVTITDAATLLPIAGARATLRGDRAPDDNSRVSDAAGVLSFESLRPGLYAIEIAHAVHFPTALTVDVPPGVTQDLQVALAPLPSGLVDGNGRIAGTVLRAGEQALPPAVQDNSGIVVEVVGQGVRTFTNLAGEFTLDVIPGTYDISFAAANHVPQSVSGVTVGADETVVLNPVVLAGNPGALVGTVYLEGRPLPAQLPVGTPPQHGDTVVSVVGGPTGTTAADGTFRIAGVAPGRYAIRASQVGFDTATVEGVEVRGGIDNTAPTVLLALSRGSVTGQAELVGRPAGAYGGTTVGLQGTPYGGNTNADGGFLLEGVPVGTYTLVFSREGYGRIEVSSVLVASLETTNVGLHSLVRQQGDFLLDGGQEFTNLVRVPVTLVGPAGNDQFSLSGADVASFRTENSPGGGVFTTHSPGAFVAFDPSALVDVDVTSAADGPKAVTATFRDSVSLVVGASFGASITLDRAAPTFIAGQPPLVINGGAAFTNQPGGIVTLGFAATDALSGVSHLRVSNDGTFDSELWEPFTFARTHTVQSPTNPGPKTVVVQFRDFAGNETTVGPTTTAGITLDFGMPSATRFEVLCGNPASEVGFCDGPLVRIEVDATDDFDPAPAGVSFGALANEEGFLVADFRPFTPVRTWLLSSGDGNKTVSLLLRDAAGNTTGQLDRTLEVDGTPPTGVTVIITGDAASGASTALSRDSDVTLTLAATDMNLRGLWVSNDNTFSGSLVMPGTVGPWSLAPGDGTRTVYVRAVDAAGNVADASRSIVVDATPPALTAFEIVGSNRDGSVNRAASASPIVSLEILASGASEIGVSDVDISDCSGVTFDTPYSPLTTWTLPAAGEVWVCVRDAAGNVDGPLSDSIVVDETAPSCTVALQGYMADGMTLAPAGLAASPGIDVVSTCSGSPVGMALVPSTSALDCTSASYGTYQATARLGVDPGGAASKNVRACYRDAVGNVTASPLSAVTPLTYDGTPPQSPTLVVVRDGAAATQPATSTNVIAVDLFPQAVGADFMRFGNSADLSGVAFTTAYTTAKQDWNLAAFTGMCATLPMGEARTVYAQYRDALGNASPVVSYALMLDPCPPGAPTVSPVRSTGADAGWSRELDVSVEVSNLSSSAALLRLTTISCGASCAACPATTGTYPSVSLTPTFINTFTTDGLKRLCVLAEDEAGNRSSWGFGDITVDTTPPAAASLTLTQGLLYPFNHACARIQASIGADPTFRNWESRSAGSTWQTATMFGPKVEVPIFQDADTLVEIRAVDRAGNVGGSNGTLVSEVSSTHVPTPLSIKRVCGNGDFALLWDPNIEPYYTGGQAGNRPRDRDLAILDLSTNLVTPLNGPGGVLDQAALAIGVTGDVATAHDAICNNQGRRLLVTYFGNGPSGSVDETLDRHRMAVVPDALDPTQGVVHLVNGGPIRQSAPTIRPAVLDSVWFEPNVTISGGYYTTMMMTTSQTQVVGVLPPTSCRGVYRLIHGQASVGGFNELGEVEQIYRHRNPSQVPGPTCDPQNDFRFPSVYDLRAVGMPNYSGGVFWFHGYILTSGTSTSFLAWNQQGGMRYTIHNYGTTYGGKDLWGKRVRESQWEPGSGGSGTTDTSRYTFLTHAGALYGGAAWEWSTPTLVGTGGLLGADGKVAPAFENGDATPVSMSTGWVSGTNPFAFVYGSDFASPVFATRFRYQVDNNQPVFHTYRFGPGARRVVYNTSGVAGPGVVVGYEDLAGCAE